MDTAAKRTLWFNIIPLLDEDDQEYAKRKICVTNTINRRDSVSFLNPYEESSQHFGSKSFASSLPANYYDDGTLFSYNNMQESEFFPSRYSNDLKTPKESDPRFYVTNENENAFDLTRKASGIIRLFFIYSQN